MKITTREQYEAELAKIKAENMQKAYETSLQEEKKKCKKSIHVETNKLMAIYLFILLNAVIIYAMIAMWTFADLQYLGLLISDIAAQVLIYAIYCMKAYKAKKSEEELKFRKEQSSGTISDMLEAASKCEAPLNVNGDIDLFTMPEDEHADG